MCVCVCVVYRKTHFNFSQIFRIEGYDNNRNIYIYTHTPEPK